MLQRRTGLNLRLRKKDLIKLFWTALALVFVLAMIWQPKIVYLGALSGLKAWWNIVFPSLLPFFIASELLMAFGIVRFLGILLEPVMRPLFNVPGTGAFVMVIGFTSGFPIGSMVTARLRQDGLCTRLEGERLMSFTNNSSPLFMLVAVAVGMFGRPDLGLTIAGAHYLASLVLGLLLRFYGRQGDPERSPRPCNWGRGLLVGQALQTLLNHLRQESRPLGKLIGEAVSSSITKLFNIGGFIILFAVIIRLFTEAGVIRQLSLFFSLFLAPLGFTPEALVALSSGFFEMTIGTKLASEAAAPELQRLMTVAMILGWSGLSVHAQVASMIAETDLSMKIFVLSRVAHGLLSAAFTWLLYTPGKITQTLTLPVLGPAFHAVSPSPLFFLGLSCKLLFCALALLIFCAFIIPTGRFLFRLFQR
ncbi:sporulation integral membrane protein YlbJ [Desulforamulus ruminis]|uniref:sporulation integral membrane protein YlbJ n=1 Tax=Desulforamulus ruminis TaxID=1564 RepID=UPI00235791F0|nr:sporulation integral membrane protein YlbJ [Desulforamulus ruminis]